MKKAAAPYKNKARYWGNFSKFAAVGGKREPLAVEGETVATRSFAVAMRLFTARTADYERALERHARGLPVQAPERRGPTLGAYAKAFLIEYAAKRLTNGKPAEKPRDMDRRRRGILSCLKTARLQQVQFVSLLEQDDIDVMLQELAQQRKADGEVLSLTTVRNYAAEFSVVLSKAVTDKLLATNFISVSPYMPEVARRTALDDDKYLTRDEMKRLLQEVLASPQVPYALVLVLTLAYTGMRREEAMALLVQDIDFLAGTIRVAPNDFRDGKSKNAYRPIPLWLNLSMSLAVHVRGRAGPELVFRAPDHMTMGTDEQPIGSIDGTLQAAARRAGIRKHVTHHMFRHSYASARLQMLHRTVTGTLVPVDRELIVSEIGHSDAELLKRIYAHVTRDRVDQVLLDFGERASTPEDCAQRATAERSARIVAGLAARTARGEVRRPRGQPWQKPQLTAEEQRARQLCAGQIRKRARAEQWSEQQLKDITGASPAEVTAILRGDLSRLPLARMQSYAEEVARY